MAGCYEWDKYLLELVTLSRPQVGCENKDKDGRITPNPSTRPLESGALDSVSHQSGANPSEVAVGAGRLAQSACTRCRGFRADLLDQRESLESFMWESDIMRFRF